MIVGDQRSVVYVVVHEFSFSFVMTYNHQRAIFATAVSPSPLTI